VLAAGGFPYKITQPGSYKLSGNLVVPTGADGIDINVSNVTIDLNGFTISGPVTCTGSGASISCGADAQASGILALPSFRGITVRNGCVVGFVFGIVLSGADNLVEETHADGNAQYGILVTRGVVRRNSASSNGQAGIFVQFSTVTENIADDNGGRGVAIGGSDVSIFGNNILVGNPDPGIGPGNSEFISQGNNVCDGVAC
jgi:parallel beta-helix repeat protein